ncbi:hypothetical protein Taro_020277 [Colocasia esculenta]|uniref:CCHC-type domain-containing protein n=1 Tax=Colocasia esculenta TaxID=4460 RepID=A0A843UW27_COLES|nr:hypothetical protein [Colocasia esculenta]
MKKLMDAQKSTVASGSGKSERIHCGKRHGGNACWRAEGKCLRCGSKDHRLKECPNLKTKFIPRSASSAAIKEQGLAGDDLGDQAQEFRDGLPPWLGRRFFNVSSISPAQYLHPHPLSNPLLQPEGSPWPFEKGNPSYGRTREDLELVTFDPSTGGANQGASTSGGRPIHPRRDPSSEIVEYVMVMSPS